MDSQNYILREDEEKVALPILEFLKANRAKATEWHTPPRSHRKRLRTSVDCKTLLRHLSSTYTACMCTAGKLLKGKLKMENIWVTLSNDVKLKDVELCSASRSNVNATYQGLSHILRNNLFHKGLPLDIQQWLEILESKTEDAYEREFLIKCHPSLMTDRNQLELLMRIYKHLWPIKEKLRKLYNRLTAGLPYEKDWKYPVTENKFLYEIYYEDKYGQRTEYRSDIMGLMHFLKNSDSHLHEKALPPGASEPLFQLWDLGPITFGNIPLFIGALAERLFQYNEYRVLDVADLMG